VSKAGGGRDPRHEPDEEETPDTAGSYLVDRVFAPPRGARPASSGGTPAPAKSRTDTLDNEPALRRQLSRLQRQLSELQLELSRKDDELANEVENRLVFAAEHLQALDAHKKLQAQVEELGAERARVAGVEQRLLEAVGAAEDLAHARDRERALVAAANVRITELQAALDEVQQRWKIDRALLEQQHADELERIEGQKRIALEQAEEAIAATNMRLRQAYEDQLAQLREAHERAMSALRGEVEPKLVAARDLAADRERLADELAELRQVHAREAGERDETHKREVAQLAQQHATQQDTRTRLYSAEIARVEAEREAKTKELEQMQRAAKQRELAYEDAAAAQREATKRVQVELAEVKENVARLDAAKASAEERLAAATATNEQLVAGLRALNEKLDASAAEARRNAFDRRRFAAYLEEGLALIGALPADGEPAAAANVTSDTSETPPKE